VNAVPIPGGWGDSEQAMKNRAQSDPQWVSSNLCPDSMDDDYKIHGTVTHGGILSSDCDLNPDFCGANHVYQWYCTSDSHLGDKGDVWGWQFRGKRVTAAVIRALGESLGKDSLPKAELVLFTGDSAGGVGAMNNLDYVRDLLKPYISPETDVRGYIGERAFLFVG
jgi:hypothetical protein